jgi:hypothetical protein
MLRGDGWSIVVDVSGQRICIIIEDHAVQQKQSRRAKTLALRQQSLPPRQKTLLYPKVHNNFTAFNKVLILWSYIL